MRHPTEAQLVLALDRELDQHEAAEIAAHLEACGACRGQWEQLKTLSEEIVEYHHGLRGNRSVKSVARVLLPALAIAALLLVALFVRRPNGTSPVPRQVAARPTVESQIVPAVSRPAVQQVGRRARRRPAAVEAEPATFIELPFSDSALPLTDATIVRVAMPVEDLRLAGLTVDGRQPGSMLQADLLVGIDGLPRGIRFVQQ
ncbi:MAG TPA: zf-HC2 domain-containing protein [Bryobacteraceae bacterium]|nr:zf-HC2 domain-containing protein [Bryobacteraceae bacterium]